MGAPAARPLEIGDAEVEASRAIVQPVAKVTDVVGLRLEPPDRAIVLSVDEETRVQALDRTQRMLPPLPGTPERHTHDYRSNGTINLFAALDVATGHVTHTTRDRGRLLAEAPWKATENSGAGH